MQKNVTKIKKRKNVFLHLRLIPVTLHKDFVVTR